MENDISKKSLLKKSNLSDVKRERRVSFCNTVQVFIDELGSGQENSTKDNLLNCVEVSIKDKSSDNPNECIDISKADDCNATDFLVHKVIYETGVDQEDDDVDVLSEEADENSVLFETNADDEGLHFVVHKVTDHEDDLIQQELDLEDNDRSLGFGGEMDDDIIGKLSELSLENILTHDKIIAFIDQNTFGLSSLLKSHIKTSDSSLLPTKHESEVDEKESGAPPTVKNSELFLSPPLQELSLEKIVRAQSGNVLCELDISPLNSILETDSDSDLSSEGTMIMMTTEESEKNEQHIKESFQKYELKKKEKVQKEILSPVPEPEEDIQYQIDNELKNSDSSSVSVNYENYSDNLNESLDDDLEKVILGAQSEFVCTTFDKSDSSDKPTFPIVSSSGFMDSSSSSTQDVKKMPLIPLKISYRDSLSSVKIPKDVREWKILCSPEKNMKSNTRVINPNSFISHEDEHEMMNMKLHSANFHEVTESTPKMDELEKFVLASKERVQRIRKRYLQKAQREAGSSVVQSVRPRFGSTAEILQLVQRQNQQPLPSFSKRNHISWPCNTRISDTGMNAETERQLNHLFGCQSLPNEFSYISDDSSSSNCDYDSVSSCPSIFFHERGAPEGASPPRSLSEDITELHNCEDNPNNVVYFSMKV